MSQIQEAESVSRTSSASFFSQEEIDHVLRLGSNAAYPRVNILFAYQHHIPASQIMTVLKNEYVGGSGFKSANGDFAAWYAGDGIHLSRGHSARFSQTAQVIPWLDAAERIGELLQAGQFVPDDEFPKADVTVRTKLAEAIVRVNGALTESAVESGLLPSLRREKHLIFPVEIAEVSRQLADLDFVDSLYSEFQALCEAYRQDKSIFTYLRNGPDKVMDSLTTFTRAVRDYPTGLYNVPEVERFITDDEIDHLLGGDNPSNNRVAEIHTFFTGDHTAKEKADYLKNTEFVITEIRDHDVELRDPSLLYPIFRAESKEQFERLLRQDDCNSKYTQYLGANLLLINEDIRDALTRAILTDGDKDYIPSSQNRKTGPHIQVSLWRCTPPRKIICPLMWW